MTSDPLSPRAQALLDAARDGLGPDEAAIARMRANVLGGAAGGVGVAAGATKTGLPFAAKLGILAVVAGALGAGGWMLSRGGETPRAAAVAAAPESEPVPVPVSVPAPVPVPVSVSVSAPGSATAPAPVALSEAPQVPSRRAHPANAAGAAAAKPGHSLADEVALVDDAMAALRRDDARAALAAADDHVARFGKRGQLAEEASAIRVESLCRLGDARWSSALDTFDTRWPRSAQRPRLTTACKGAPR